MAKPTAHAGSAAESSPESNQSGFVNRLRARYGWLDHVIRAATLYTDRTGDILAGSITYFGFLALFPLLLLAASVFGFILAGQPQLLDDVIAQIGQYIPGSAGDQLIEALQAAIDSRGAVGIFGLLGLLYAGLGWIGKLRLAIQTLWQGRPESASFLRDKARDLLTLVGIGGGLAVSLAATAIGTAAADFIVDLVGLSEVPGITLITGALAIALALAGSTLVFAWLFSRLSGHDISGRSVLPGAILAAAGFEILKLIGAFYLSLVSNSVSAGVFGSVVGILLFIYLACRFLLFCVAWTATLPRFARLGFGPGGVVGLPYAELGGTLDEAGATGRTTATGAPGDPSDPGAPGSSAEPPRAVTPSPAVVAAGLVATGALAAVVTRPLVRLVRKREAGTPESELA